MGLGVMLLRTRDLALVPFCFNYHGHPWALQSSIWEGMSLGSDRRRIRGETVLIGIVVLGEVLGSVPILWMVFSCLLYL